MASLAGKVASPVSTCAMKIATVLSVGVLMVLSASGTIVVNAQIAQRQEPQPVSTDDALFARSSKSLSAEDKAEIVEVSNNWKLAYRHVGQVVARDESQQQSQKVMAVARRAFDAFAYGEETNETQPFIDMVTNDFTFMMPVPPPFKGLQQGKARLAEYFEWRWNVLRVKGKTTLTRATVNNNAVVFEWSFDATKGGQPFKNTFVTVITVRGDKVSSLREYTQNI